MPCFLQQVHTDIECFLALVVHEKERKEGCLLHPELRPMQVRFCAMIWSKLLILDIEKYQGLQI